MTPRCRIASLGVSLPGRHLLPWGSVDHAVAAGKRCLAASQILPGDVEVLVNAGVHRDGHICEPAMACYIQDRLGINVELQGRPTLSFDLACGGAGMLLAVQTVAALLTTGAARVGLVVSSESNPDRRPDPAYTWPASGAAVLLDLAPRAGVGFGAFATVHADEHVPAQISAGFLHHLPGALGVAADRVADLTAELPDTHTTSVFLALYRVQQTRPLQPGQRALLLACGSGVTAIAAVYHA